MFKKIITSTIFLFSLNSLAQLSISPAPSLGKIEFSTLNAINIVLSNTGSSNQVMNLSLNAIIPDNANGFSMKVNRCQGKTLLPKQSCYVVIGYDKNQTVINQSKEIELKNGSSVLTILKGSNLSVASGSSSFVQSSLSFSDAIKTLVAEIKNDTNSVQNYSVSLSGADSSKFTIISSRCQQILPQGKCVAQIRINQNLQNGSYSASVISGALSLPISATIASSIFSGLSQASYSASVGSLDFGSFFSTLQSSAPKVLSITNIGQTQGAPIIEIPAGVEIELNRCSLGIKSSQSCSVSFSFKNNSSLLASGTNYSGNILIKKTIGDLAPISIPVQALLMDRCPTTGFEFSYLLNSCVDMRPKLAESLVGLTNPTSFTGPNQQNLGIFTPTMNGGLDINLFKKDPKNGTLTYQIFAGIDEASSVLLTDVPQASFGPYPTLASQYFSYLAPSLTSFQSGNPYFRLFIPYNASVGTKTYFVKVIATSSVSGYSNSISFNFSYENDAKFAYGRFITGANSSQKTVREVSSTLSNNPGVGTGTYRDIAYINPANNSLTIKAKAQSYNLINSYSSNANARHQVVITQPVSLSSGAITGAKLLAFYEYNYATAQFYRKESLGEPQSMTCNRSGSGEISCVMNDPSLANDLHGKHIVVRNRIMSAETLLGRSFQNLFLAVNDISGTPCGSPASTVASPFHGIKVVDWNADGIIQASDVYMQICTATELRSLSYSVLASPLGLNRRLINYRLESDIDMAPYYAGGGYKFYIKELFGHFDGQNHSISNFIVNTVDTKNNSAIATSEASTGANLIAGNGEYSGAGSFSQLGLFSRLIGARISDLTVINPQILGNGWTSVGLLSGMAYSYIPNLGTQGSASFTNLTTDSNVGAPELNMISNVVVKGVGVDVNGRSMAKVNGSTTVGGLVGNLTGDRDGANQFVANPFKIDKSKVENVAMTTNSGLTQGSITFGGFAGGSYNGIISRSMVKNLDVKDNTSFQNGVVIGGMVGYAQYLRMNNSILEGLKVESTGAMGVNVGGAVGIEEGYLLGSLPVAYNPFKSTYSNLLINFDVGPTYGWSFAGTTNVQIGKFHATMRNVDISNSFAIGAFDSVDSTNQYTGSIAGFVEITDPMMSSTVVNVETFGNYPSIVFGTMNKCGIILAMCDSNPTTPTIIPSGYYTNKIGGSPSIQSWDFTNVWRQPTMGENSELPYLIGL